MFEPNMLLKIEELAKFLTSGIHNASQLGEFLTENTLESFDLISIYIFRADQDGKLRFAGGHNLSRALIENMPIFEINIDLPITECIRNQKIIWLTGRDEWESQYPLMKNYPIREELKTFINIPLHIEGHPIAALGLSSRIVINRTARWVSTNLPEQYDDWSVQGLEDQSVFVGLESEYHAFKKNTGWNIPWQQTSSMLELAEYIAGAKIFIGNQSQCYALAVGLGVPQIYLELRRDLPKDRNECYFPNRTSITYF